MLDGSMKPISGYEAYYAITDNGRVFSLRRQRFLSPRRDRDGYLCTTLFTTRDNPVGVKIHQLVLAAYGPPRPSEAYYPHHKNGDRSDNRIENLEWRKRNREEDRPKGFFVYVLFTDQGAPLYVGSSRYGFRLHIHEKHKEYKQDKRIGVVVCDDLDEAAALQLEATLIAAIGVRPSGPLVNHANYRNFGWHHTEAHKQQVSTWTKGRPGRKGIPLSYETRAKISESRRKGSLLSPRSRLLRKVIEEN